MTHTVVTFGEIMLRLSPPGFERFFQSPVLSAIFGGGEANVAASLAHFGLTSCYVTRLPKHAIGESALRALRAEGIDTTHVLRGGDRVGIYFAESGASQRASTVVYDRAHSSISELEPAAVPWDAVMQGASWFHVTGITPALGSNCAEATAHAIAAAKRAGARVSVDLNYRKKLWSEAQAQVPRPSASPASSGRRRSRLPCARACRRATTAGARCCGMRRRRRCIRASAMSSGWSIASAAATASRRA